MLWPVRVAQLSTLALALCALLAGPAQASRIDRQFKADANASAFKAQNLNIPVRDPGPPPGAQVLNYKFGPMKIQPGQNLIGIDVQKERPDVDGWIVGFRPGLTDAKTGKNPSVAEVHLHHAVWLVDFQPTFAAGEEKTNFNAPPGFGWRYTTKQSWILNHMIHDLVGSEHEVNLTYTLYFIPDSAPEAASIKEIKTQWMDVQGVKPYPVFNALKGRGTAGKFTYPDQAKNPYPGRADRPRNQWVADRDATLVNTAGHLHPGGLWTDLNITRDGKTVRIFRSRANYYEPSGATSWDVSMSATHPENWRVQIKKGDILSTNATYDTTKASWYEVMGIMVVGITADDQGGVDPFTGKVDETDFLTHGRLAENIDPPGTRKVDREYANSIRMRQGPFVSKVTIKNFYYSQGDLLLNGKRALPPSVPQGKSLTFVNADNPLTVRFHTVTACKAPCNRGSGIGFPLADGRGLFDSGELGYGPTVNLGGIPGAGGDNGVPLTAAIGKPTSKANCKNVTGLTKLVQAGCVGSVKWRTPKNLTPGTYTYFCRVHPFMRGAFRVVPKKRIRG